MESALDWPVLGLSLFLAVLFGSLPFANFCFRCFGNFLTVTIEIVLTPLARFFSTQPASFWQRLVVLWQSAVVKVVEYALQGFSAVSLRG